MITRNFRTVQDLKTMLRGYELLFGAPPAEVKIVAIGSHGTATSIVDTTGDHVYTYIAGSGMLVRCGTSLIECAMSDGTPFKFNPIDNMRTKYVTHFTATFS